MSRHPEPMPTAGHSYLHPNLRGASHSPPPAFAFASGDSTDLRVPLPDQRLPCGGRNANEKRSGDEEPAVGGGRDRARRRRRRGQDGEEGRGEEPAAAHEGALPQAVLSRPVLRRRPRVTSLGAGVLSQPQQGHGHGDAAGPPGQRGGVHQAAQGADRGAEAAEGQRRLLPRARGIGGGGRRRAHAGDRGAAPGRDAGGGARQRGPAAVQAARGDHGAGAGGRGGRQRQLLRRRRQGVLHAPLAGAQLQDRARGVQGLREAARPASAPRLIIDHRRAPPRAGRRSRTALQLHTHDSSLVDPEAEADDTITATTSRPVGYLLLLA